MDHDVLTDSPTVYANDADGTPEDAEDPDRVHDGDDFDDVVPTSLAELADAHAAPLVDGDFFPTESAPNVTEHSAKPLADTNTPKPLSPHANHQLPTPGARRVRWADDGASATPIAKHAQTFFLPLPAHAMTGCVDAMDRPDAVSNPNHPNNHNTSSTPTPVFQEERNRDGTVYFTCRALRPARRFVNWRRAAHSGLSLSPNNTPGGPFRPQPGVVRGGVWTPSLFAALHPPPTGGREGGQTVVMRVAKMDAAAMVNGALCDGGRQLPMVRVGEVHNDPHIIPFA